MNPIKKFAYITTQFLFFFPLAAAGLYYRDVHDFDNYYKMLCRKLDWFIKNEKKNSNGKAVKKP